MQAPEIGVCFRVGMTRRVHVCGAKGRSEKMIHPNCTDVPFVDCQRGDNAFNWWGYDS